MCVIAGWGGGLVAWTLGAVETGATFFLESNLLVCNKSLRTLWPVDSTSIPRLGLSLRTRIMEVHKGSLAEHIVVAREIFLKSYVMPPSSSPFKMLGRFLVRQAEDKFSS